MTYPGLIFSIILMTVQATSALFHSPPTVRINGSRIVGEKVEFAGISVHKFVGIPFAQPPLGDLRFQKPRPVTSYPDNYQATTNKKACWQYTTYPYPWYISGDKSEDCLYVNVWVPASANKFNKKAVMFWIYGGAHRYGGNNDPVFNGVRLAALGDIIVVTVNYRLSFFGFLYANTTDAPGNVGIWDILEGLKWTNKYIAAFGGDVSRITIAGESAGSINVGLLTVSPLTKGLYARQIMESASPAYRRADNNTQNIMYSQLLAKSVGCASDTETLFNSPAKVLQCLRGVDAETIIKLDFSLSPSFLVPQFGDEILPENPRVSVINNNFRCTDLLIGTNKDEGSFSLALAYHDYFGFTGEKNSHVNRTFGQSIIRKATTNLFPDPDAIANYYIPPSLQDDTNYQIRKQTYDALGDTVLECPAVYYAEKCSEQNRKVYYYEFTHRPSVTQWAPWIGVTHFEEVQFVFGQSIHNSSYTGTENVLGRQMVEIWSSFVKNGKPSIPWPRYDTSRRAHKILGPGAVTGADGYDGPHKQNCEFLKSQFGF